ncbi:hypothetical protein [Streptomyces sp. NPDC053048]|uniref:hypothetical protein n=1 Tax=Streptomyces sp. NPDC053048 TaxID=3365694 RepID=UPI0037D5EFA8
MQNPTMDTRSLIARLATVTATLVLPVAALAATVATAAAVVTEPAPHGSATCLTCEVSRPGP